MNTEIMAHLYAIHCANGSEYYFFAAKKHPEPALANIGGTFDFGPTMYSNQEERIAFRNWFHENVRKATYNWEFTVGVTSGTLEYVKYYTSEEYRAIEQLR
jgi:hypothetical protein